MSKLLPLHLVTALLSFFRQRASFWRALTVFLTFSILIQANSFAAGSCDSSYRFEKGNLTYKDNAAAFDLLADRIELNVKKFINVLTRVENHYGAKYEIDQVIKTLRGVKFHEAQYLSRLANVENVAVYGSTNIPLYTLVMHALIPASVSQNVWFRTPQATREIYVALFDLIKTEVPELASRIHLLTDPKDVQYDNFRKMHVLGLNRKGNRFDRNPADVVIFVGSPETGREVLASIKEKLESFGTTAPKTDLNFLLFGSGLNPVIITESAKGHLLEPALSATIEAIKINSSQDCIAPKLYLVNDSVNRQYLPLLLERVRALRYGELNDPLADYGPLAYRNSAEDFNGLIEFRNKHSAFLKNPEAVIDPLAKRVDPHVFVFPYEMFTQVELKDYYAPFIIQFDYSGKKQLTTMANDPRLRERAMFASIFADSGQTEIFHTRKLFEDNYHFTTTNVSVFLEESGNFPFGGYGGTASTLARITKSESDGDVRLTQTQKPLLFSRDVAENLAPVQLRKFEAQLTSPETSNSEILSDVLTLARSQTALNAHYASGGKKVAKPNLHSMPLNINEVRKIIAREKLWTVVPAISPTNQAMAEKLRYFYGENLIFLNTPSKSGPGVVIHPSFIGDEASNFNRYRGNINLSIGFGALDSLLFGNKALENKVANAIWPGVMANNRTFRELVSAGSLSRTFLEELSQFKKELDLKIQERNKLSEEEFNLLTDKLTAIVTHLLNVGQNTFANGAFLKNYGEVTTGDLGNQITTFYYNPRNYALQFMSRFSSSVTKMRGKFETTSNLALMDSAYETGLKMITRLLTDPNELLFQERLKIKKTDLGFNVEVRVDFFAGEGVYARSRYTHEYLGRDLIEAKRVITEFLRRAPPEFRMMSGGADVVKLEDGSWRIIELNAGPNSGTALPQLFIIHSNEMKSALQGFPTPLISKLESIYDQGPIAVQNYLKNLRLEIEPWHKNSIDDLSIGEVARWFRDRVLADFDSNPTELQATQTLTFLTTAFYGVGSKDNRDLDLYLRGTRNYLTRNTKR